MDKKFLSGLFLGVVLMGFISPIFYTLGRNSGIEQERKNAIARGHGRYYLDNHGEIVWQWISFQKE